MASYNARCALFAGIVAVGSPDEQEVNKCEMAYRILSRARDCEVFGDPKQHRNLPVDTLRYSW